MGGFKSHIFERMYEAEMEFPERCGGGGGGGLKPEKSSVCEVI